MESAVESRQCERFTREHLCSESSGCPSDVRADDQHTPETAECECDANYRREIMQQLVSGAVKNHEE